MLDWQTERRCTLPVHVEYTEGKHQRRGTFHADFHMIGLRRSKEIVEEGSDLILEHVLLGIGKDLTLRRPDQTVIEDEQERKETAMDDPKIASAMSRAYWKEAITKKD